MSESICPKASTCNKPKHAVRRTYLKTFSIFNSYFG
jgi:hypothetical protein